MSIPNLPSLDSLPDMTVEAVSELPDTALADISEEIRSENTRLASCKLMMDAAIKIKFKSQIDDAYKAKGKSSGVAHVENNETSLSTDSPHRVNWDSDKLKTVYAQLEASPDYDADEFISVKYSVAEKSYQAWPTPIKKMFEAARTVTTGKTTYKLARKEAE